MIKNLLIVFCVAASLLGCEIKDKDAAVEKNIYKAIEKNDPKKLREILNNNPVYATYLHKIGKNSSTPLAMAASLGNYEVMKVMLVEYNAKVDSRNGRHNSTELMIAAANHCNKCIDLLLAYGANINALSSQNETALMNACQMGNFEGVKLLLIRGADLTIKSRISGVTALDEAAKYGHYDIVKLLLQYGATTDFKIMAKYLKVKLNGMPDATTKVKNNYQKIIEVFEGKVKRGLKG